MVMVGSCKYRSGGSGRLEARSWNHDRKWLPDCFECIVSLEPFHRLSSSLNLVPFNSFIGYIAFEVPSNLALKALKPHRWIPVSLNCSHWDVQISQQIYTAHYDLLGYYYDPDGTCTKPGWTGSCPFLFGSC
jgi:hypothetical protein